MKQVSGKLITQNKYFAASAFLLLTFSNGAYAGTIGLCAPANVFVHEIYNCGANEIAVKVAQDCSDALMAKSLAEGKILQAALDAMRPALGDAQSLSMTDTATRLQLSIQKFTKQIIELQANTAKVASYTEAMIDFADGENDDTSADCFSRNFHQLQKVVDNLDNEIMNAKNARSAALTMLASVQTRGKNLEAGLNSFGNKLPDPTGAPRPSRLPVPKFDGDTSRGLSDISGTREEAARKAGQK
ncbi:MAG: hypothetical protein EOP11_18645 [Proteobacteria bacterium]|nr:MAG: hypothetical protein EOP11_18645 [Pseudomonadota bacterium]